MQQVVVVVSVQRQHLVENTPARARAIAVITSARAHFCEVNIPF
jgi:hypothetical protein